MVVLLLFRFYCVGNWTVNKWLVLIADRWVNSLHDCPVITYIIMCVLILLHLLLTITECNKNSHWRWGVAAWFTNSITVDCVCNNIFLFLAYNYPSIAIHKILLVQGTSHVWDYSDGNKIPKHIITMHPAMDYSEWNLLHTTTGKQKQISTTTTTQHHLIVVLTNANKLLFQNCFSSFLYYSTQTLYTSFCEFYLCGRHFVIERASVHLVNPRKTCFVCHTNNKNFTITEWTC